MDEQLTFQLPGYDLLRRMHESTATVVYGAVRLQDNLPVVIKLLKPESASPTGLNRIRHEYEVTRSVHSASVIKVLALESYEQTLFLVLEDIKGRSLRELLGGWGRAGSEAFALPSFLALAARITEGLSAIHAAGIIHMDLCPANVVVNPASGKLRIIDFDAATTLNRETPSLKHPRALEGTLAYLAPEQTGRLNRTVDYRADFYSFGVMMYELLTGQPPFVSSDPLELVHHHLAKTPDAPHLLNSQLPAALSSIVLKLMAKAPEERYQSATGLLYDLRLCEQQMRSQGRISAFQPGTRDRAERFLTPEKLYGRAGDVATLLAAFDRASKGSAELVLVQGFPGIGKTAVVNEVHGPIARQRGYFIGGKFDQLKRGIPFSGFVQALRDLMGQMLAESDEQLRRLKADILSAMGENGRILIDVIPELERIIGRQPEVPELFGGAAQNRFNLLFRKFIGIFATAKHPLVIFLDDTQWADLASLKLMQLLMGSRQVGFLLLVCAYRDNEVSAVHPFRLAVEDIKKTGAQLTTIALSPLSEADINRLIADTLGCSPAAALPLASLVYQKTRGNPFFNNRFLTELHDEGLITFNGETGYWECDIARVGALALTDDVVQFLARQLRKLPSATQAALILASCIGNSFSLGTLATISKKSQVETATDLWPALQAGLLLPQSSVYRFYRGSLEASSPLGDSSGLPSYRFLHDRAQQAAYLLIPPKEQQATHLRIGQLLHSAATEAEREESLFEIVNQFNKGVDLLDEPRERRLLAELNLTAGKKAKAATAYRAAEEYLGTGRRLLPPESWSVDYRFSLELYEYSVEAAYLGGDFELMESLAEVVLRKARNLPETVKVYEVRIEALAAQNRLQDAVHLGLPILASLGVTFPEKPSESDVQTALRETQACYRVERIAGLIDLPLMVDPYQLATMRILIGISPAAFLCAPTLYSLLILRQVRLSIEHGNTPASAFCYASYGLILCGVVGDIEAGYQFGRLALELVRRLNAKEWQCKVPSIVATFITHWKTHIKEALAPLRSAYHFGLEIGDLQFAGYSAVLYTAYAYFPGIERTLPELQAEIQAFIETMLQLRQITVVQYYRMLQQAVHDLMQGRDSFEYFQGEHYDEQLMMPRHIEANDRNGIFYVHFHKLLLSYLFGNYHQALKDSARAQEHADGGIGFPYLPIVYFYDSLTRLAVGREAPADNQEQLLRKITANQARLRTWAQHAPMNILHKIDLVDAEQYRLLGDRLEAIAAYDRAITGAAENGYLREEALANELAAAFYLDWGKKRIAQAYLQEAQACYGRWGAWAKVAELERRHAWLRTKEGTSRDLLRAQAATREPVGRITGDGQPGSLLDLTTVIKAAQAIAAEIDLPRLLMRLVHIAVENAGAQRGALILEREGEWVIEALQDVDGEAVVVRQSLKLQAGAAVSADIVLSVVRTQESVVLGDAAGKGGFSNDPYIARHGIKSVLCAPLVNQGRLSGIIYLENNLTKNAFSAERLELLHLLSAQMALALDNAGLYQRAQQEIQERRFAEEALRASEQRFRAIFDTVNDAIFVHDPFSSDILDVNSTMCTMYGYTREEALQLKTEDVSAGEPPYGREQILAWLRKAAEEGPQLVEWRAKDKGGRLFWVEVNLRRALIGGRDRILVVARDISLRKQAAEQIRLLNEQLEKRVAERTVELEAANRELESFSYSVSHDLRSPLRAIAGYAHILETEHANSLDAEVRRLCAIIKNETKRLDNLIEDLLAFSRAGRREMRSSLIDMRLVVLAVLEELRVSESRGRLELRLGNLPPAVGDPTMIRQVWQNLLSNAIKFSSRREKALIEVGGEQREVENLYYIRDNGTGFDMRYVDKLFEVFQRLHSEREFPGTGVGLAIVKRVVHRHGGRVWAEGEPGKGATFSFTLPQKSRG